jgi:hypothetical protein
MTLAQRFAQVKARLSAIPRDQFAELLVIVVVVAALLAGWAITAGAESRAVHIEVAGLRASYGYDWIREQPIAPEILRIVDPGSGARFPTTISVRAMEPGADAQTTANVLNQERSIQEKLYQVMGTDEFQLRKRTFTQNDFAYVYVSPDLLNPTVPVVVHGTDTILPHGGTTYVITCTADEAAYQEAQQALMRLLRSMSID